MKTGVADWGLLIARPPAERERESVCVCEEGREGADCDGPSGKRSCATGELAEDTLSIGQLSEVVRQYASAASK